MKYLLQPIPIDINNADIWDDTLLIKAYDDALKITKEEVAKRLANLTNRPDRDSVTDTTEDEDDKNAKGNRTDKTYKLGHHVRATYDVDNVDYEAKIIEIHHDGYCSIEFVGYGNQQTVAISELLPSWGRKARKRQIKAAAEQMEVNEDSQGFSEVSTSINDRKHRVKAVNRGEVIPNRNGIPRGNLAIPPPPPMPPMLSDSTEDDEHLSAMLMSWYMSGYYTGLYQGQKLSNAAASKYRSKRNK